MAKSTPHQNAPALNDQQLFGLLTTFFRGIKRVTVTINFYSEIHQIGTGNAVDSRNVRTSVVQKGGAGNE